MSTIQRCPPADAWREARVAETSRSASTPARTLAANRRRDFSSWYTREAIERRRVEEGRKHSTLIAPSLLERRRGLDTDEAVVEAVDRGTEPVDPLAYM